AAREGPLETRSRLLRRLLPLHGVEAEDGVRIRVRGVEAEDLLDGQGHVDIDSGAQVGPGEGDELPRVPGILLRLLLEGGHALRSDLGLVARGGRPGGGVAEEVRVEVLE